MSFFSNFQSDKCPGTIAGNPLSGLTEKVCIQAEKVFDAAITTAGIYQVNVILVDTSGSIQSQASTTFRVASAPAMEEDVAFETSLSVGYGRVDISPTEPTPLRGYGYSSGRLSKNIKDPLYATCIAVSDTTGQTVLIFTLLLSWISGYLPHSALGGFSIFGTLMIGIKFLVKPSLLLGIRFYHRVKPIYFSHISQY